jgi:hypothetical protein
MPRREFALITGVGMVAVFLLVAIAVLFVERRRERF